jgi:nitrite reductase/ring-hydroxylating ferredoxin subunit
MDSHPQGGAEKRYHKVASVQEIKPGSGMSVEVDGDDVAIFNFDGEFYAINDLCPHRGAPLSEGFLDAGKVFCAWHCFDFNLKTGESATVPSLRVQTYEVKVEGEDVFILR